MCPWADAVYGCDGAWWHHKKGLKGFQGIKLANDVSVCRDYDVNRFFVEQGKNEILYSEPAEIGDGGNSGFQALNAAVQFGASRILLVGFDMRIDLGLHWHGRHARGLNNPSERNLYKWRTAINEASSVIRRLGIEVLNASPASTLTAYPFIIPEDLV